jgi:hypothetical protein
MAEYEVVWRLNVDAKTPEEAAAVALAFHRDPDSLCRFFDVNDDRGQRVLEDYEVTPEREVR